jgi:hypothetical protein
MKWLLLVILAGPGDIATRREEAFIYGPMDNLTECMQGVRSVYAHRPKGLEIVGFACNELSDDRIKGYKVKKLPQ